MNSYYDCKHVYRLGPVDGLLICTKCGAFVLIAVETHYAGQHEDNREFSGMKWGVCRIDNNGHQIIALCQAQADAESLQDRKVIDELARQGYP